MPAEFTEDSGETEMSWKLGRSEERNFKAAETIVFLFLEMVGPLEETSSMAAIVGAQRLQSPINSLFLFLLLYYFEMDEAWRERERVSEVEGA